MLVGQKVGKFFIEKELGSGAMGTVYRGRYLEDNRRVALKMIAIALSDNETAVARFEREASILKQLRHPNIVSLFGTGRHKGTPYFAMEYVEGESLDRIMARRVRFSWQEIVEMGKQICAALQHAHEKGIIHRDLKPSNLMRLDDGTIKLTDFGIAKDLDVTALTGANATVGTAAYMSPEQCRGETALTSKSDLYSLGVVFFELLTGRKPFQAESPVDMFMKHVTEPPPRPSRLVDDMIPVWLDTLILQLLEKKPEHRPLDAAMVGKSLDEVMQKVNRGASAAVDAVSARAIDRRVQSSLPDEADREAARALRSVLQKKKIKKRSSPSKMWWWLPAVGIVAVLAAVVGLAWLAARPDSPDELYRRAERMMSKEEDYSRALVRLDGKDGPVREFLRRYPDHPNAKQVAEWRDLAETHDLMARLRHNFKKPKLIKPYPENLDQNYEALAFEAFRYEDFGDTWHARDHWRMAYSVVEPTTEQRVAKALARHRFDELTAQWNDQPEKDPKAYCQALLKLRLADVAKLKSQYKEKDAADILRDIQDLYSDEKVAREMELGPVVEEARRLTGKSKP
jgi:serine/threonine-protein kinase